MRMGYQGLQKACNKKGAFELCKKSRICRKTVIDSVSEL